MQLALVFETPETPAGLDYQITLEPLLGNPDMEVFRIATGAPIELSQHLDRGGIDRVRIHAEDIAVQTSFLVRVGAATLASQFALTVEAFFANVTIAQPDLQVRCHCVPRACFAAACVPGAGFAHGWSQTCTHSAAMRVQAVRAVAAACCAGGGCVTTWDGLAMEASTAPASMETDTALCRDRGIHCNEDGQITSLDLSAPGFMCTVPDLAPLGQLTALERLIFTEVQVTGAPPIPPLMPLTSGMWWSHAVVVAEAARRRRLPCQQLVS